MQQDNRKTIIGGGVSGLIWKYYHPEYQIITPNLGGNFASNMMIWLHDTVETRKLLTDLGYEDVEKYSKKAYIGYHYKQWITETLTKDIALLMIQKKMSDWSKPVDRTFIPTSFDFSTTSEKTINYLKHLNVDLSEVIKRLTSETITGIVNQIDKNRVWYKAKKDEETRHFIEFDTLVSTIPAPTFWKMYGQEKEFKYYPTTNVIVKDRPDMFHDKFGMVYYDDNFPFTRISHIGNRYAFEFTGDLTLPDAENICGKYDIENMVKSTFGRIFDSEQNVSPQDNIIFLGRFASWQYGITVEHVIAKTLEYAKI